MIRDFRKFTSRTLRGAVMCCGLLGALASVSAHAADQKPAVGGEGARAILVLDASGSMWGQIEGKAKITIAREVIRELVDSVDPSIELGLTAYGHRRKGDCADIQHLLPVERVQAGKFVKAVEALKPKGKTPLGEAVRQAAEALRYTEERATVILVSDGKETCGVDPCALGKSLEESGVEFTAHVIGFDLPVKDQAPLRCLAESTGGQFLLAENAAGLAATLGTVVERVVAERPPINTRITLVPKEGAEPFERVDWIEIYPVSAEGEVASERIAIDRADNPGEFTLPVGKYQALAQVGKGQARADFQVVDEELTELTIVVGVGDARITLVPKQGSEPFEKVDWIEIYPVSSDGEVASERIAIDRYDNPGEFTLPAGTYQALAQVGKGIARANFEVAAEELTELTIVVGVGEARVTVVPKQGSEPTEDVDWIEVYPVSAGGGVASQRIAIARYANPGEFTLPAGRYQALAKVGKGTARADFEVAADDLRELIIVVGVGEARITLLAKPGGEPMAQPDWIEVYPVSAAGEVARDRIAIARYDNPGAFILPAGKYQALAKAGKGTARADFEVVADEVVELTMIVGVGEARVTLLPKQGAEPFRSVNWVEIYPVSADGKVAKKRLAIEHGDNPSTFTLPAGQYQARAQVGKGTVQADFEVSADEVVELTLIVGVGEVRITLLPKRGAERFRSVDWIEIYPVSASGKAAKKRIAVEYGDNPAAFTLLAGKYQMRAQVGKGQAQADFEVAADGRTDLTVVLPVGSARLVLVPRAGAAPYEKIDWVEVYPIRENGKVSRRRIDIGRYRTPSDFVLPAGDYEALASADGKQVRARFSVEADGAISLEIDMSGGN